MFAGLDQDHGYVENAERQAYSDNNDEDDDDGNDVDDDVDHDLHDNRVINNRRSVADTRRSIADNNMIEHVEHEERHLDKNYSCRYKCKALHTPAIRCRHGHVEPYDQPYYQQQQLRDVTPRATAPQSVINLARCSSTLDTLCAVEASAAHMSPTSINLQHPHFAYTQAHHSPHIAYSTRHTEPRESQPHQQALTPPPTTIATTTSIRTITPLPMSSSSSSSGTSAQSSAAVAAAAAAAANRRDHNIDYSTLFVQLSGTLPTLYRCVNCNKIVSNRWHHANIHRPQSHECPVCGQKFTRRDNMKAHCKIKHADIKDRFFSHYVHM